MNSAKKKVVDWEECFPGRFLKSALIGDRKPVLTIKELYKEKLPNETGGEKMKGIIGFRETEMEWALNRTNAECLKAMFGKQAQESVGKRVALFKTKWNGDDCIRVWGSPDIDRDMQVEIRLPRRKPFTMTMHAMKPNQQRQQPPEPEPEPAGYDDMDPEPTEAF